MKTIKIFTSITCPNCPPAKAMGEKLKEAGQNVQILSINEADGLAEAQLFGIMAVPAIVIADENDQEVISWKAGLPSIEEVIEKAK
ncbi:thioredoxin [bacterium]|nr:MAG: thioredoxin [bacterium]